MQVSANAHAARERQWIGEIDLLRGFAILAVVAIHVTAYFTTVGGIGPIVVTNVVIDVAMHYAVPLFIVISGLVLSHRYREKYDLPGYYRRRMAGVVPQYLCFSALSLVLKVAWTGAVLTLPIVAYNLLTASSFFHLWFFALIIQFYLLYPAIKKVQDRFGDKGMAGAFVVGCLAAQLLWVGLRALVAITGAGGQYNETLDTLMNRVFIAYLFYFALGMYAGSNIGAAKRWLDSASLPLALAVFAGLEAAISGVWLYGLSRYSGFYEIPYPVMAIADLASPFFFIAIFILLYKVSAFLLKRESRATGAIRQLGNDSFGLYLVHGFYVMVVVMALGHFGISPGGWVFYPLAFVAILVPSYITVHLIYRLPFSDYIVGQPGGKKRSA